MPATIKCWLSPDGVRRCSDVCLPSLAKSTVTYLRPSPIDHNDHSITLTVVGSTNSVRKLCNNNDSPLPSPRHDDGSTSAPPMIDSNGHLMAPTDYNSGSSVGSTLTVDDNERSHLLNGVETPKNG